MELVLNLCWLSLLLPAFFLWRQRTGPENQSRRPWRPVIFAGTLGCAFILLFPVISATDDLHTMRPEMEESERAFSDANSCSCAIQALAHLSQTALIRSISLRPEFEQIGTSVPIVQQAHGDFSAPALAGRAPPIEAPVSL